MRIQSVADTDVGRVREHNEDAHLVVSEKVGRSKLHYLNPVPIQDIADRWIDRYRAGRGKDPVVIVGSVRNRPRFPPTYECPPRTGETAPPALLPVNKGEGITKNRVAVEHV